MDLLLGVRKEALVTDERQPCKTIHWPTPRPACASGEPGRYRQVDGLWPRRDMRGKLDVLTAMARGLMPVTSAQAWKI